jgi:hypothetical protein
MCLYCKIVRSTSKQFVGYQKLVEAEVSSEALEHLSKVFWQFLSVNDAHNIICQPMK